jgi:FKBP-type peptidyl-prolyl cis-trans isomerase FklB
MKKHTLLFSTLFVTTIIATTSCNNETENTKTPTSESNAIKTPSDEILTIEDTVSYVIGMNMGSSFSSEFPEINFSVFSKGLSDYLEKSPQPLIDMAIGQQLLQKYFMLKRANIDSVTAKATPSKNENKGILTLIDSVSYVVGNNVGENLNAQFPEFNLSILKKGLKSQLYKNNKPMIDSLKGQQAVQNYFMKKQELASSDQIQKGEKFLEINSQKEGVITLPSGLQYKVLKVGNGPNPTLQDEVLAHYHGTLIDGTVFDSSVDRGEPSSFPVNGVIPGWTEALQLMSVGSKWKLYIPYNLAYGERGAGQMIGPYSTLIFDVELIKIN